MHLITHFRKFAINAKLLFFSVFFIFTTHSKEAESDKVAILNRTWKLAQIAGSLSVQPSNFSTVWWSIGIADIANRPCLYNHEYIFTEDGTFEFKGNGSFWFDNQLAGAAGVSPEGCALESKLTTLKVDKSGQSVDVSAWQSNKYLYEFTVQDEEHYIGTLTLVGEGAFLGLPQASGDGTRESVNQPFATSTTYKIKKLVDGKDKPDTLEVHYLFDDNSTITRKTSWKIVLVSYKDSEQEFALAPTELIANFNHKIDAMNSKLVKFNNTSSINAVKYQWDFGDGSAIQTVSDRNQINHTYTSSGTYKAKLTAFNSKGERDVLSSKIVVGAVCANENVEHITSIADLNLTFKSASSPFMFDGFGGVISGRVANPVVEGINKSCWVHMYQRSNPSEFWGGAGIGIGSTTAYSLNLGKINFKELRKKGIAMKVYSPEANTKVQIILEKDAYPDVAPFTERTITMTKKSEWEELIFNFSGDNSGEAYGNMLIYFDRGVTDEAVTYYFDDVRFVDVD